MGLTSSTHSSERGTEGMRNRNVIRDSILTELPEDFVGLWWIPSRLRDEFGISDPDELRRKSLLVAASVLAESEVVFGQFSRGEFCHWPETGDDAVRRIEREWRELGHEPDIGDIGWFDLKR